MELGKNIIKIRKDNNLTQETFAEKYFVTRQTVSSWENSKSYPDLETIVKISNDFNISLDILLKDDHKMVENISKKQNNYKYVKIFVVILNIIGIACLIYFAIPFIRHDMSIVNSNAMLASYSWDSCGFILTLGLIPLIIANIMSFIYIDIKKKILKCLFFIPSLVCLLLVLCYLFGSFDVEENNYENTFVGEAKCELNGKFYHYMIYQEQDGTYSIGMDDNDKIPQSVIDYNSPEEIFNSIEKYYKDNGGMCS